MANAKAKKTKLWGGRFAAATAVSVEAFTASIGVDVRLYRHDIMGSIAHAKMLAKQRCFFEFPGGGRDLFSRQPELFE